MSGNHRPARRVAAPPRRATYAQSHDQRRAAATHGGRTPSCAKQRSSNAQHCVTRRARHGQHRAASACDMRIQARARDASHEEPPHAEAGGRFHDFVD
ncbi:hypothetical protein F511_13850 [Dorcoceras hygrometricum]|uniref:Uncharacterized protein n=1 Tax=Dorcoceras hygrometricum TaxID=472368 RepID=A0A2Z7DDE3_9LAMI|nr:hypothetical protein F511_13850 [Dorcoceras hygrometricum]